MSFFLNQQYLGDEAESVYQHSCRAANIDIVKSKKIDDYLHVDFLINDGQTVDVKTIKKTTKSGLILVEIQNVKGQKGWCNPTGTPEWIAFWFGAFFLHVNNADLYKLFEDKVSKKFVPKFEDCILKRYQRKGRKDIVSLIPLSLILNHTNHWYLPTNLCLPTEEAFI